MQRLFGWEVLSERNSTSSAFRSSQVDYHLPETVVGHKNRSLCDPLPHAGVVPYEPVWCLVFVFGSHCVSRRRYLHNQFEERLALMQKKIVGRESLDRGHGASILRQRRPDDGNRGKIRAEEFAGLRQDQVGLEHLTTGSPVYSGQLCVMLVGWIVEISKSEASFRVGQPIRTGQRLGDRIASLIMPKREVIDLDSANAQEDSQDLATGCLEGQYRIQTRPSLFDK